MEVLRVIEACLFVILGLFMVTVDSTSGFRGEPRKTIFNTMDVSFASTEAGSTQTDEFPNELHYTMNMEGATDVLVSLHLVRDKFMHTPEMMSFYNKQIVKNGAGLESAIYTDANGYGSFACIASTDSNGDFTCKLSALLDMGDEACFIPPGSTDADCINKPHGIIEYYEEIIEGGVSKSKLAGSATIRTDANRRRRSMTSSHETLENRPERSIFPEAGFQVVEVAFFGDKEFMSVFYDRNPGNDTEAEIEAGLYVTLLTNEINVCYASINEVSNGALDIYIYPAVLIIPSAGTDFSWIEDNTVGSTFFASGAVDETIAEAINDGIITTQWDHAMILTGLDISYSSSSTLGYAYTKTVCNPSQTKKFSVNEVRDYNIGRIAAHEIGHALGMYHDSTTQCPAGTNVMSSYIFDITSLTSDTYHKFSACSVVEVIDHLANYPNGCTTQGGFTDAQFKEAFCSGLPGSQEGYLDLQCQRKTGWSGSTPCNTPTEARDCYEVNRISCRTSNNDCDDLRFVYQGTTCGTDKVCYKGDCVDSFNVCDPETTTTTSSTTTTTPTTTTTTPTTTTTTPTTTTTTPTTTTTTPTTTTTTPTTTTTTPTTTTTTPTTTTSSTTTSTTTTTTPTTTTSSTTTSSTTTSTTTTTTPTTTTTTPTTTTTTPTTTTTTPTTTTTTPTTTTTKKKIPWAPCTCCGFKRNKRRLRCCKTGRRNHNNLPCYCCGSLTNVLPPGWFKGPKY